MAEERMKKELDIFDPVLFQRSIANSSLIQYRPVSSLGASSQIEFEIPTSPDEYLDFQNVYLWIKAKVTDSAGADFAANHDNRYSLINYGLNTMFDQLTIHLDTTQISQSSNTYHYLSYIEAITQNNPISSLLFIKSAGFISTLYKANYDFDAIDTDLHAKVTRSKIFTLYGKLHNGLFQSDRLLLNGVTLRIALHRAPDEFTTMGLAAAVGPPAISAAEPKINLNDISLFVRKCKLEPSILMSHAKKLSTTNAIYPIKRSEVNVWNLPSGQSTFVLDNVYKGQLPCKLIFGLVTNDAYSGSYTTNPLKFANYGLNYIYINRNGEYYPKLPYTPDFRANYDTYEREYYDFFLNLGALRTEPAPAIRYDYYKSGLCLFVFNFNADFENTNQNEYINLPSDGFMNIELRFSVNLVNALKLICYAQFDNTIEIDENRNITIDW